MPRDSHNVCLSGAGSIGRRNTGVKSLCWGSPTRQVRQALNSLNLHLLVGKVNWKTAPRGTFALAHDRPPCATMIERHIDGPAPKPPGLVV
jgi:hypothetical protein